MKKIKKLWLDFLWKIREHLDHRLSPPKEDLVRSIVLNTARMCLAPRHFVELAPVKGMIGCKIKLCGNSLPIFTYTVFHKPIMEFVKVTVEISAPSRIQFVSAIESNDPKANGQVITTLPAFSEPFYILARHLHRYFPFYLDPASKTDQTVSAKTWSELVKANGLATLKDGKIPHEGHVNGAL